MVAHRIVELLAESPLVIVRIVSTALSGRGTGCEGLQVVGVFGTLLGPEATRVVCVLVTGLRGGQTVGVVSIRCLRVRWVWCGV